MVRQELVDTVVRGLPKVGAFKLGVFHLVHHKEHPELPLSPFYFDLRMIRAAPQLLRDAVEVYSLMADDLDYDCLADVPTAGTLFAANLILSLNKPMVTPRLDDKWYGSGSKIEGRVFAGQTALLIDDLITSSRSKRDAIAMLEAVGLNVKDVLVLLDRQQGGSEELEKAGYRLHAAATADRVFEVTYGSNLLTPEAIELCEKYRRNELSAGWQDNVTPGGDKIAA